MALIVEDRIAETSTSTGTGDFTLAGSITGFRAFSAVCATSDTLYYLIEAIDANGVPTGEWETGLGTYSAANTLTRTTVSRSSNANAAVSFAAGTKRVSIASSKAYLTLLKIAAPSIQTVTSSATVTPTFSDDMVKITAQAAGLTLANPTGTAVPGWGIAIRIKDNGTAQTIAYGTQYRAIGVTLPTTTVISKTLYLGMIYNSDDTKWDVVAVAQEA